MLIIKRFLSIEQKLLTLFIFPLICLVFMLLHTNQSSSQSMASVLLICSPLCFLFNGKEVFGYKNLRILFTIILLYFIYNFFTLTQHSFNQLSLTTYRALFFWLLLPLILILLFSSKPSPQTIALVFSMSAIFSLYPVINDFIRGNVRGASSGHPIFWGNISLCSGVIAYSLRNIYRNKILVCLSYFALACGLAASLWSLTRGGWISIPVSILCLYLCKSISKKQISAFLILLAFVIAFVPSVHNRMNDTISSLSLSSQGASLTLDVSTQLRLDMWNASLFIFKENPIIGNGFSSYQDGIQKMLQEGLKVNNIASFKMPHNEFINLLLSGGLIATALFFSIIISLLKIFHSFKKNSGFKTAGYLLVIQFLIFSLSEIFFSTKLTVVYFCIAAAFIIYAGLMEKKYNDN